MNLPPQPFHESVVPIDAQTLDEVNWTRLSHGTLIRAFDQAYLLVPGPRGGWQMSCFVKADNQRITGRTVYRRPRTWRAWLTVLWPAWRKLWSRWTTNKSPHP